MAPGDNDAPPDLDNDPTSNQGAEQSRAMHSLERRLDALDITQLKALILRMIEHHEELEALVDTAVVATGALVDLKKVRMRARTFLGWSDHNWRTSGRIAAALDQVVEDGEALCAQERWFEAVQFFGVILEEVNAVYGEMYDSEGEVARTVDYVLDALKACLAHTKDATTRSTILHSLLTTFDTDLKLGGSDSESRSPTFSLRRSPPMKNG
jgi:hypothetical protein